MSYLLAFLKNKPPDVPESHMAAIKKEIERGVACVLTGEKETNAFSLYILGNTYADVAESTGWPINTIIMTSLKNQWYEKKQTITAEDDKNGARHIMKSSINAILAATAAIVTKQMQQVIKGEIEVYECKYIPKDIYALEKFVSVVNQIHKLTEKADNVQNINVNVANLGQHAVAGCGTPPALMNHMTLEEYNLLSREERLKMLTQAKSSVQEEGD